MLSPSLPAHAEGGHSRQAAADQQSCPCHLRRDDHGFSPLHWACREGRSNVVDMLIMRGARINVMNRGDDTPLHLAASHGHRDIVQKVLASRSQQAPYLWQTEQDSVQPSALSTQDSLPTVTCWLPCYELTASPPWHL